MHRMFLETIVVSRYCLNFLSSRSCSYRMKGAFVKIILASGEGRAAEAASTSLDSNSFLGH